MALISCPECKKEVSDKAAACIHCGYPLSYESTVGASNPETVRTVFDSNVISQDSETARATLPDLESSLPDTSTHNRANIADKADRHKDVQTSTTDRAQSNQEKNDTNKTNVSIIAVVVFVILVIIGITMCNGSGSGGTCSESGCSKSRQSNSRWCVEHTTYRRWADPNWP